MSAPADAAARAAELREQVSYHSYRYHVLDDPEVGDDVYDALFNELEGARDRVPGPDPAGLADPARRRGAGVGAAEGPAPRPDALARERPLRGGAAGVGRAHALTSRARGDRGSAVPVRGRAEDRRPRDLVDLSRRRARAWRHPRQRRGRRGRHAQPAHDRGDPAARGGRTAAARGPRRDLHVAARLRGAERATRRGGPVDVHEPAQLGRRDDPPARSAARRRAPAVDVVLRDRRHGRAPARLALGGARVAARTRLPRQRRRQAARQRGRGRCPVPGVAGPARRTRVRDRRRGREGRRLRAPAPARRGRPRPALGDRLEVPADDRRHAAEGHQLERGQVRRPVPVRDARARPRERRHGQDGDAAQRGGPRAQGRARR